MSNWPLYFAGGIGFGAELPSAFVDATDVYLTKTVNAAEGSAHTATSPVSIGGAGIVAPGAFYAASATLVVPIYAAWATNTAYSGGALVTANGHLYFALVGGTSAASGSGPAATTTAPITDNSVTWSYVSPAPASGAGLIVNGTELVAVGGNLNIAGTATVENGANLNIANGGAQTVQNGGTFTIADGGFATVGTGTGLAVLAIDASGVMQVGNGGGVTVTSSGHINLFGALTVENTGSITVAPDGGIVVGGSSGHPGQVIFQNFSAALHQSGSTSTWNGGATLTANSGSAVTLAGTNTFSGTNALSGVTTQTGAYIKSGNGAQDQWRILQNVNTTQTIAHPENYDLIVCNAGPGAITLTLGDSTGVNLNTRPTRIVMPGCGLSQGTVTVVNATGGATVARLNPNGVVLGQGMTAYVCAFVEVSPAISGSDHFWTAVASYNVDLP